MKESQVDLLVEAALEQVVTLDVSRVQTREVGGRNQTLGLGGGIPAESADWKRRALVVKGVWCGRKSANRVNQATFGRAT